MQYAHLHNTFSRFLYNQSRLDAIVKGVYTKRSKIKLAKIAKMASVLECKGDTVLLGFIVLTSGDIIGGEILMESSCQD